MPRSVLKRLGRSKVDLLLMHWPGPGYSAMGRSKERIAKEGIQCYYKKGHEDIACSTLRKLEGHGGRLPCWKVQGYWYFELLRVSYEEAAGLGPAES